MGNVSAPSRHLAAVWFADIVGYSTTASSDARSALLQIRLFQEACTAAVLRFNGRIVKFTGDGALAEFRSTHDALNAALSLRSSYGEAAAGAGVGERLRIGVHVGDVAETEDRDLFGDAINISARLSEKAPAGGVLVSEEVWKQLRPFEEFDFSHEGRHHLKGLAYATVAYSVVPATTDEARRGRRRMKGFPFASRRMVLPVAVAVGLTTSAIAILWAPADSSPTPNPWSIAILPFNSISANPADQYIADGIMEDLRAGLYGVESLEVTPLWTVRQFAGSGMDFREIGEDLQVRALVEGAVRVDQEEVTIYVSVVEAHSGENLWNHTYDARRADVFILTPRITEEILLSIGVPLTDRLRSRINSRSSSSNLAYERYLRGVALLNSGDIDSVSVAIRELLESLRLDPDYQPALDALLAANNTYHSATTPAVSGRVVGQP